MERYEDLTKGYGKGFSKVSLWRCVRFHRAFPDIMSSTMTQSQLLTWTYYQALLKKQDDEARAWHAKEAYKDSGVEWIGEILDASVGLAAIARLEGVLQ